MTIHTNTTPWSLIFCLKSLHMCRTQCFHSPISKTQVKDYQYYFSTLQLFSHTRWHSISCPYLFLNRMDKWSSHTVSPNFSSAELLYSSRPVAILVNAAVHLTKVTTALKHFLGKDTNNSVKTPSTATNIREKLSHGFSLSHLSVLNTGKITWLDRKATTFETRFSLCGSIRTATINTSGETGKEPHAYARGWGTHWHGQRQRQSLPARR